MSVLGGSDTTASSLSPIWRTLLDIESIPDDAEGLRLAWELPWPAWLWVLMLGGAGFVAMWSYARLSAPRPARTILATMRFFAIAFVLVLISGPMVELPRESVEQDWLLILADRSASMTIADADRAGSARGPRDGALRDALVSNAAVFEKLARERQVHWLGFNSGAFGLEPSAEGAPLPVELGSPTGRSTNLDSAFTQALQRAAARPVSGVLVLSDGRTTDPPGRALLRRLQAEAIPVFAVPLGSPEPVGDVALRRIDAPRRAFVSDRVPVVVEMDRLGAAVRDVGATVKLVDELTGEVLDEQVLEAGDESRSITLTAKPSLAGEATWKVVVETAEPDLIPENNSKAVFVELVDRPLRVLYVDGYPRWEYRYLKNLLVREESIESSVMLLSADRDFAQEGNTPITRLPRSPEEIARYDVIVLGDAPASFFPPEHLEMLRDHVAERGAGLLWIGGERFTPASYDATPLADLLPMRGSVKVAGIGRAVTIEPTALAERLGVLQLITRAGAGWPDELRDPAFGWSQLWWVQRIEPARLKPTAEVLAQTVEEIDGAHLPVVIHLRYGAGQSIYVATDEIWRWRYGRGDQLPDQFWIQMIRMLGRESLAAGDQASLEASPRRLEVAQPLSLSVRLLDSRLLDARRASVRVRIEPAASGTTTSAGGAGGPSDPDAPAAQEIDLPAVPGAEDRFAATWLPDRPGAYVVRVTERDLQELDLRVPIDVYAPDDELERPETDHALLAELAEATGGRVLQPEDLTDLPELLPNRAVRTLHPLRERIWDTPLALALLVLVLTAEWIGRKIVRLM